MACFKKIKKYKNIDLPMPVRKTPQSAGYDFVVAEDRIIPSIWRQADNGVANDGAYTLSEVKSAIDETNIKPTLVPTGYKCYLEPDQYLELSIRSSSPLKYLLVLANGCGIIDSDYVDNESNEGHIFFQIMNFSTYDIMLKKGDIIGQGIIKRYETVDNDSCGTNIRKGGFGSTNE